MIQVQGVARSISYDGFSVDVIRDEQQGCVAAVFITPAGDAHVFPLPAEVAEQMEDKLREARGGVKVARLPVPHGVRNGRPA